MCSAIRVMNSEEKKMHTSALVAFCLLTIFSSQCLTAPAVVGAANGWTVGKGMRYQLTTTVLSRESGVLRPSDVGFQLTGHLKVSPIWADPKNSETILIGIELESPQLWIKSRKAPEPEGFIKHSSKLSEASPQPIYILWRQGQIIQAYLNRDESVSSANLKRGLASLFQYRRTAGKFQERDASGLCNVTYSLGQSVTKTKTFCEGLSLPQKDEHPNPILGIRLSSWRTANYRLNGLLPSSIDENEQHELTLEVKPEVGTTITTQRVLKIITEDISTLKTSGTTAIEALTHLHPGFIAGTLDLEVETTSCPGAGCPSLEKAIEDNRNALENSALGTSRSAAAFLKLIPLVRNASVEDLTKVLKSTRYKTLRTQLFDVLGSAATPTTHAAAMKILRTDDRGDETERYLWALSMSPLPHVEVIEDVLKRSEEVMTNERVSETLALTAAAMARTLGVAEVVETSRTSLEMGLDTCSGDECRCKYLRALRNLRSAASVPILLRYALEGTKSTSVAAWRALRVISTSRGLSPEVKAAARRTFFQIGGPRRDSSARTLAADVILENNPTLSDLETFAEYLTGLEPVFEVRRYVSQRVEQLADKDMTFQDKWATVVASKGVKLWNYNVLAHRGLSTAFTRPFFTSAASNGSLVTVQEVNSGLLKRGIVDVTMKTGSHEDALFSLGLFAGGLGNFVSSASAEADDTEDIATAGMEIDFLGVGIRPFVFFSGQGELMGHVWSGTASERTPAFQEVVNLHRHRELVPLAAGFVAEIDVEGAVSFDLSGQIQLSLWSRNAQSLVEMAAGVAVRGGFKVAPDFVSSVAEFVMTVEPKLTLATDVDFSGPVSLCMRLTQDNTAVKNQVYKIERIPGSRHRLRKIKRIISTIPARSYLLNRKNNEMCSKVFT